MKTKKRITFVRLYYCVTNTFTWYDLTNVNGWSNGSILEYKLLVKLIWIECISYIQRTENGFEKCHLTAFFYAQRHRWLLQHQRLQAFTLTDFQIAKPCGFFLLFLELSVSIGEYFCFFFSQVTVPRTHEMRRKECVNLNLHSFYRKRVATRYIFGQWTRC